MKRLILLIALSIAASAFGATQTNRPIQFLLLQGNASGGGNSFTNLNNIVASNNVTAGKSLTLNGVTITNWLFGTASSNYTDAATNTLWVATTNLVTVATNTLWIATTNLVTGATNTLWIATTNLVTGATNTLWVATTNLVTGATNAVFISSTNAAIQAILSLNYVTQIVTNGLASLAYVDTATNAVLVTSTNAAIQDILARNYATASVTNGLASLAYVDASTNTLWTATTNALAGVSVSGVAYLDGTNVFTGPSNTFINAVWSNDRFGVRETLTNTGNVAFSAAWPGAAVSPFSVMWNPTNTLGNVGYIVAAQGFRCQTTNGGWQWELSTMPVTNVTGGNVVIGSVSNGVLTLSDGNVARRDTTNTFTQPQTFASNIIVGASLIGTNTYTERLYTNVIPNGATNIIPNGATNWTQGQGYVIQMTNDSDHVIIGLNTLFSTEASGQNLIYVGDVGHVNTISYAVSDTELRVNDTVPEGSGLWVFYWGQIYDLTNVYDLTNIVSGYTTNAFQLKFGTFGEFGTQTVAFAPTPLAASVLETMGYNLPITNVIGGQAVTLTLTNRTLILGDDVVARRDSTNLFTDRQTLGYPTNTLGGLVVLTNLHEAVVTEDTNWVSGTGSIDYSDSITAHILGNNTLFMSEISPGDRLRKNGVVLNGQVSVVISDVELYMTDIGDHSGYESFDIGEVSVQTNYVEIANSAGVVVGGTGTQTVAFAATTNAAAVLNAMGFTTNVPPAVTVTSGTNIVVNNTGGTNFTVHTSGDVLTNGASNVTLSLASGSTGPWLWTVKQTNYVAVATNAITFAPSPNATGVQILFFGGSTYNNSDNRDNLFLRFNNNTSNVCVVAYKITGTIEVNGIYTTNAMDCGSLAPNGKLFVEKTITVGNIGSTSTNKAGNLFGGGYQSGGNCRVEIYSTTINTTQAFTSLTLTPLYSNFAVGTTAIWAERH